VRELGLLCLATLPVVLAALFLKDPIEAAFESPRIAALMLLVTGLLLLATRFLPRLSHPLSTRIALPMGLMQVLSLMPGISRSGATICGGLFGGGRAAEVVRFSFLMSIPAILGAVLFQLPDLREAWQAGLLVSYGVGFLVSFASGMLAIQILLRVVVRGRFFLFGIYCLIAGLIAWILLSQA
jgi:undecaprenyl-diphosphatase